MSRFGGTALAALQGGQQAQQGQAAQISDVTSQTQQSDAQRDAAEARSTQVASSALAAGAQAEQAGLRTLQAGAQSVSDVFGQMFQMKFQRDLERERADRQFRIEDGRRKTAELNDLNRIIGTLQEDITVTTGDRAPRLEQLAGSEVGRALTAQSTADLSRREQLLSDAQRIREDIRRGVANARTGAHSIAGRFIRGSEATAQVDQRLQAALVARGGYGLEQDNRRIERLARHEAMVSRSVQLGVVTDMGSIASTMKKGSLSDEQLAQKLMSSSGIPQTARMSDIVSFLVGGDDSKEDREEKLDQFIQLADSGKIDVSTLRGVLGGLEQLTTLGPNSLAAVAGENDLDADDRAQLNRVALKLQNGFNLLDLTLPGVTEGIKRDRTAVWRQALLNGHPNDVETQTKVFKAMDDAAKMAPQLIGMLSTGTPEAKEVAVAGITELAGLGPSGDQGGDIVKAALDATVQSGGASEFLFGPRSGGVDAVVPPEPTPKPDLVERGIAKVGLAGAGPEAGPTEIVARGAADVVGRSAQILAPELANITQLLGSGKKSRRFSIANSDSKTQSGKSTLLQVVKEADREGIITKDQARRLARRIAKETLEGQELLDFFDGLRARRSRSR